MRYVAIEWFAAPGRDWNRWMARQRIVGEQGKREAPTQSPPRPLPLPPPVQHGGYR
ncbi:MAG TPA: hypothetical protein VFU49_09540 [Ktedonobacteraceae bacterium]|nr:hypothetical protein [Ktedonobacteraceae bacterium]